MVSREDELIVSSSAKHEPLFANWGGTDDLLGIEGYRRVSKGIEGYRGGIEMLSEV